MSKLFRSSMSLITAYLFGFISSLILMVVIWIMSDQDETFRSFVNEAFCKNTLSS